MSQTSGFIYGSFRPYVDSQISVRQDILSGTERTSENLLYLTGKTAWVKMTSAVNFTSGSALAKQYGLYGDEIAKQYQLFGGTLYRQRTTDNQGATKEFDALRYGYGSAKNKGIDSFINYGLGGYKEAGFRPMPGIENANIKSKNQFGSLKEATINFKCWNIEQLNILESLYMRPGYQVLLEWGHTIYYDNNKNLITGNKISTVDFFDKNLKSPQDVLKQIENKKLKSSGNYDGILGIIKNFSFTANEDGSYSCMTNLVTWGEVVESLKISAAPLTSTTNTTTDASGSIKASRTQLEEYLKQLKIYYNANDITADPNTTALGDQTVAKNYIDSFEQSTPYYSLDPNEDVGNFNSTSGNHSNIISSFYKANFIFESKKLTVTNYSGEKDVFIPLARLLLAMNNINGLYGQKGNNILPINYSISSNKALTSPLQFSADPKVCFYPANHKTLPNGSRVSKFSDFYSLDPRNTGNPQVMHFMALAVNVNYVIDVLNSCIDEQTLEIDLLTFLKKLMNGINNAMGNYNKYDVIIDNNTIKIVDLQLLPLDYGSKPSLIVLSNQNDSDRNKKFGFCYSYNFSSRITNKLTNTIAISAQANAQALNMDNVSFSKLNKGMKDRINPYINDSTQKQTTPASGTNDESPEVKIARGFVVLKNYYAKITKAESSSITDEEISQNQNFLKDILNKTKSKSGEGTVFIPIDLNVALEGIAGMRLGECFQIENEKLPLNYKYDNGVPKVKFLVRTLDHSISNNRWTTNVSALSVVNAQGIKSSGDIDTDINNIIDPSALYQVEVVEPGVEENAAAEAKKEELEQAKKDAASSDPAVANAANQKLIAANIRSAVYGSTIFDNPKPPIPYVSWDAYLQSADGKAFANQFKTDANGKFLLGTDGKLIRK